MRKEDRFPTYCLLVQKRLTRHGFERPFQLDEDLDQQDKLATWIEFLNYEYQDYEDHAKFPQFASKVDNKEELNLEMARVLLFSPTDKVDNEEMQKYKQFRLAQEEYIQGLRNLKEGWQQSCQGICRRIFENQEAGLLIKITTKFIFHKVDEDSEQKKMRDKNFIELRRQWLRNMINMKEFDDWQDMIEWVLILDGDALPIKKKPPLRNTMSGRATKSVGPRGTSSRRITHMRS